MKARIDPDEQAANRERNRLLRKVFAGGWSAALFRGELDLHVEDADRFLAEAIDARGSPRQPLEAAASSAR